MKNKGTATQLEGCSILLNYSYCPSQIFLAAQPGYSTTRRGETVYAEGTTAMPVSTTPTITPTKWWIKVASTSFPTHRISRRPQTPGGLSARGCPSIFSSPVQPGIYAYFSLTPLYPNAYVLAQEKQILTLARLNLAVVRPPVMEWANYLRRFCFFEYAIDMDKERRRKNIRIALAVMAIIPIALLVYNLIFPQTDYGGDSIWEMAYLIFGVPILIFNFWVWSYPEIIERLLWGDKGDQE